MIFPDYGSEVESQRPDLEWEPYPEATAYDVSVYVMDTREFVESGGVDGTTYEVSFFLTQARSTCGRSLLMTQIQTGSALQGGTFGHR